MHNNIILRISCIIFLFFMSASSSLVALDSNGSLTNISYPTPTGRVGIRNYEIAGRLYFSETDGCLPSPKEREQMLNKIIVVPLGGCTVEVKAQNMARDTDGELLALLVVEQQLIAGFNVFSVDGSQYAAPFPIAFISTFDMDEVNKIENLTDLTFVLSSEVGVWEELFLADATGAIYSILLCIKFGPVIFGAFVLHRSLTSSRNKDKRVPIIAISLVIVASISYSFGVAFSLLINVRYPMSVNAYLHGPIWAAIAQMSLFMSTVLIFFAWRTVLDNVKSATTVQFIRVKPLIIISSVLGGVILIASVALYVSYDIFLGILILQMITGLTWLVLPILLIVMAVRWKKALKGIEGQMPRMNAIEVVCWFTKKVIIIIPFLIAQFIFALMSIMFTGMPEIWTYFVIPVLGLVRATVMYLEIYLFYYPSENTPATGTNSSGRPAGSSIGSEYLSDDTNR